MSRLEHVLQVGAAIQKLAPDPTKRPWFPDSDDDMRWLSDDDKRWLELESDSNTNPTVQYTIWFWWTRTKYSNSSTFGYTPEMWQWAESMKEGITDWKSLGEAWGAIKNLLEDKGYTSKEEKEDMEKNFALLKPQIIEALKKTHEYRAIMTETTEKGDEIAELLMKYKDANEGLEYAAQEIARARNKGTDNFDEFVELFNQLREIRDRLKPVFVS